MQQKGVFMTISSSLNAGVAGLSTNAAKLATVADNISNSSTFGYKRVEADFHSMVIGANGGGYTAGGVRSSVQRLVDERGTLVGTSNATDLAIRGRGMLPVASSSEIEQTGTFEQMMLTSTGSFRTDDEGYLRTESGLTLLGWPANADGTIPTYPRETASGLQPVQIDLNAFSGAPTTSVRLGVNLPAVETESDAAGDAREMVIEYYDNLGKSETLTITFTPTIPAAGASNTWQMEVADSGSAGAIVGDYLMTFNDSRTAGGTIDTVAETTGTAWDPATGKVIVTTASGPIEIDLGAEDTANGLTQLGSSFVPKTISKDGSPVGTMSSVEVDANGYVQAIYNTGARVTIFQIPLADVPNLNGMAAMDYQTFAVTPESGAFFLWDANDGPTGEMVSFAREESTTDVASELTDMIRTQRAYSSNAKVFQTVDEMMQETTNIKR
ncbi:flagellar hook-basal body complex protein [Pseudooceanicola sediminis]|uniref:Flagellar hook protein FlgE n=2 Tax=Pseudooceanicola sediminis TaxID=2211117 RepID=A0A399JCA8_9RHOB|nr:flagellar hook-basal body complex protein [Puniceibacterium sp. HSS470]RII40266.1 flagellar hook-basal body complex protein [Pseudooceanicola sediminis]|tara:strand:- start:64462 stop:65784 length:1323 start_codon:yes stop_codon:yes gene_type:complete